MKKMIKLTAVALSALCLITGFAFLPAASVNAYAIPADMDISVTERDASGEYSTENAVYLSPDGDLIITEAGIYILTGTYTDKMILVDASAEDKVQIVLENAILTNRNGPAIYIRSADKVFLTSAEGTENTISDGSGYYFIDSETTPDAAVFSKEDLTVFA